MENGIINVLYIRASYRVLESLSVQNKSNTIIFGFEIRNRYTRLLFIM